MGTSLYKLKSHERAQCVGEELQDLYGWSTGSQDTCGKVKVVKKPDHEGFVCQAEELEYFS